MLRFSFRCLRPQMRTSFHHQPEAQHPKSSAIHKLEGRLPHLLALSGHATRVARCPLSGVALCLLMTQSGHERAAFAAMHSPDLLSASGTKRISRAFSCCPLSGVKPTSGEAAAWFDPTQERHYAGIEISSHRHLQRFT